MRYNDTLRYFLLNWFFAFKPKNREDSSDVAFDVKQYYVKVPV